MAFATAEDIATRLGRDLAAIPAAMAEQLIGAATAVIAEAASKDDDWATALDPVPQILRHVTIEVVVRAMANPNGVRSESEQLGAHSYSQSFRDQGGGLLLTDREELLVRRAVFGQTTGSARVESIADDCCIICGLFPDRCFCCPGS